MNYYIRKYLINVTFYITTIIIFYSYIIFISFMGILIIISLKYKTKKLFFFVRLKIGNRKVFHLF